MFHNVFFVVVVFNQISCLFTLCLRRVKERKKKVTVFVFKLCNTFQTQPPLSIFDDKPLKQLAVIVFYAFLAPNGFYNPDEENSKYITDFKFYT